MWFLRLNHPESIELFIGGRLSRGRIIWLLAHPTHRKTEKETQLADGGARGWAKSRIIRMQESLVLYKSFHILWNHPSLGGRGAGVGGLYIMLEECRGAKYGQKAWSKHSSLVRSGRSKPTGGRGLLQTILSKHPQPWPP
jgi:hypothetical protein